MAKRAALGKGLGAFFGDDVVHSSNGPSVEKNAGDQDIAKRTSDIRDRESTHDSDRESEASYKEKAADGREGRRGEPLMVSGNKAVEGEDVSRETLIKITKIEPNREQPRKKFDEEALQELSDSIKEYGILQPLLVMKTGETYQIIAGERRWRAAKLAGLKEVPVIIREYDKQQSVEVALIENVQRADLNPIEEAYAYQQLMQEFGLKQEEIAARVSKNRA